ncbi:MAG: hypothetical protein LBR17_08545 [Bacteroidales bacterium]|jgi:hypothetical protein|nr:hypothetical protein [Bacteroidales bacterium]
MKGQFNTTKPTKWRTMFQNGLMSHKYSDSEEQPKWWAAKFSLFSFRFGVLFDRWKKSKNK